MKNENAHIVKDCKNVLPIELIVLDFYNQKKQL